MADPAGLSKPTIHLNGTSRYELATQHERVNRALRKASDMMVEAAPHPRDYYPQGPAAFTKAEKEHKRRLELIQQVRAEMDAIAEALGI